MIVKVIATSKQYYLDDTLQYRPSREQYQLDVGGIYVVYGISLTIFDLYYLTMDKWNTNPWWHPADVFSIVDGILPPNWYYYYLYPQKEGVGRAVWGFKEFESEAFYQDLFERTEDAMRIFEKRRTEIDAFHGLEHGNK